MACKTKLDRCISKTTWKGSWTASGADVLVTDHPVYLPTSRRNSRVSSTRTYSYLVPTFTITQPEPPVPRKEAWSSSKLRGQPMRNCLPTSFPERSFFEMAWVQGNYLIRAAGAEPGGYSGQRRGPEAGGRGG